MDREDLGQYGDLADMLCRVMGIDGGLDELLGMYNKGREWVEQRVTQMDELGVRATSDDVLGLSYIASLMTQQKDRRKEEKAKSLALHIAYALGWMQGYEGGGKPEGVGKSEGAMEQFEEALKEVLGGEE